MVPINYFAVLLAALSSLPLGFLWYGPLFGKQWIKLSGMTEEKMKKAKESGQDKKGYAISFLGALVMAYVLAHALVFAASYTNTTGVSAGVMVGVWNWLGFVMPVTLSTVLWDGKPWKLWIINNGYNLLQLVIMGLILALLS